MFSLTVWNEFSLLMSAFSGTCHRWACTTGTSLLLGVVGWFSGPAVYSAMRSSIAFAVSARTLMVSQIASWIRTAINWASHYTIPPKIAGQMAKREWTFESIRKIINSASRVYKSTNMANGNSATCYYTSNNINVIVDNYLGKN